LAPIAHLVRAQPAFVYRDGRDITGFVDGAEKPPADEAPEVALVPDGEVGTAGSYVIVMRWVHDLDTFSALPVAEQEAVIGRTKDLSIDLGEAKPPTAHIARVVIEEDGEELEIYRRSTPFGDVASQGLYFVAFSAYPSRFTKMLAAMFGTTRRRLARPAHRVQPARRGRAVFRPLARGVGRHLGRGLIKHRPPAAAARES